ncbi:uncharacterized protein LOC116213585 [Punica granatum]|uniref:Uncharacterized protein LOC116213585 n=1 Tax=Punica granatum TaxID=22663 RepID=A0A6P8EG99_PUNGR|nr:uncharacterized protein LOC116213585 [Punica granatum]
MPTRSLQTKTARAEIQGVGQVCPHRLVVQDLSLSRRQRGFDFSWG